MVPSNRRAPEEAKDRATTRRRRDPEGSGRSELKGQESIRVPHEEPIKSKKSPSARLGFWSAILTTIITASFLTAGILTPARSGPFCLSSCIAYPYTNGLAQFVPADYIWLYPGLLLAPVFVML